MSASIVSVIPYAPNGTPETIGFPTVNMSGLRPSSFVRPP